MNNYQIKDVVFGKSIKTFGSNKKKLYAVFRKTAQS